MKKNTISRLALTLPFALSSIFMPFSPDAVAAALDSSTIYWTGTTDSNWAAPSNWSLNRTPTSSDYIGAGYGSPATLLISNTGSTDATFAMGGFSVSPGTGDYVISVRGNSQGMATLNVAGGGFYSVNNNDNDLPVKIELKEYSKLIYTGGNDAIAYPAIKNAPDRATLWGASLAMSGSSTADFSGARSAMKLATLDMDAGTELSLGNNTLNISRNSSISGAITSTKTSGEALRVNAGSAGTLTVLTSSGIITLPGSSYGLVRNNTFQVDGIVKGGITLQGSSNTSLGGSGFVIGTVTANLGSAVAPGTSTKAGSLTITGTANMMDGSAINLNFFTTTQMDHLTINGALNLAMTGTGTGVNLGVTRDESSFVVKTGSYKVATVNGTMTGEFNHKLVHNFGPLAADSNWSIIPITGGYEVWVNVVHGDFASVSGLTENQYVVANMLDGMQASLPDALIMSIDAQKSMTAYGKVLNQLSAQSYQAWFPAAITQTAALGGSIENRLAVSDEKFREAKKFDVYVQASRNTSTKNTTDNSEYYEINPEEILVGVDYAFSTTWLAGLLYAFDKTDYTLDDSGSTGDSKSHIYGAYLRYRNGAFQANLIGFYGTDNYTANRDVSLTHLGSHATADTDGTRYGARAQISHTFKLRWLDFAPTLGLQYLKWKVDGFTEGGNANEATLFVAKQNADSTIGTFGAQLSRNFGILKGKAVIRPFLNAYWAYTMSRDNRDLTATVMGETVTVKAAQSNRNGWHIEAGASVDFHSGLSIFASYGNDSNIIVDQTVAIRAGVGYRF